MAHPPKEFAPHRGGESGAALVSTLLISALLLTAGGMLILTTSMTGTSSIDSAAEAQAYYGAEAGLQATLNVLRGRTSPNPLFAPDPSSQNKMTFAKAVDPVYSNLTTDPAGTLPRLSRWLPYSYTPPGSPIADRVGISPGYNPYNGIAYSVVVSEPPPGNSPPMRLLITSTGYGPRGARKKLVTLVGAYGLIVDEVPAPVVLRGHDDRLTELTLDLGSSGAETYSGVDNALVVPIKPAVAISAHDVSAFLGAITSLKSKVLTTPQYKVLKLPNEPAPPGMGVEPPWFMDTANDARTFVAQAEALAQDRAAAGKKGRVVNTLDGNAGAIGDPWLTVVKGDCRLTGGAGLLVVEGTLTIKGSGINFNGLILVLGTGRVIKTGGGNKDVYGSIMVARFGATGNFLDPTFDVTGGGNSNIQYDSKAVLDALETTGQPVLGVVEK